jgi:tetratricopeptide (TPR) repeat protein
MVPRLLGILIIVLMAASLLTPLAGFISEALASSLTPSSSKPSTIETLQAEATNTTTSTNTSTATGNTTVTVNAASEEEHNNTSILKAKVIVYIHLLRHILITVGLSPNTSAEEVATRMNIDIELANKIVKYASMNTSTVLGMTHEQLVVIYNDIKKTYDRIVEILKERIKLQERKKIKERITAKLALRTMLRLEVLTRTWNDTRLLNLTMQLREALRTRNIELAKNLTIVISDYLKAHYAEEMIEELNEKLTDLLEELSSLPAANVTIPREVVEKLKKQHEDIEELVKLIRKKIRIGVLDPATLAKLLAASDSAEDLRKMIGRLLNETTTGNITTPRVELVASEWAGRLRARIDALTSVLPNITDDEVREKLIELISKANSTLSLAEAMIEAGDYASAMHLLGKTQSYVVKAESLVRLYQLREIMKKNLKKIREHVGEVSIEDIIKAIGRKHPEIVNVTIDMLMERVRKLISQAESILLEITNKTANMTEIPEPLKKFIEKAHDNNEEAKEYLDKAIEAINSNEYFEAQEYLLDALGHALRAYHYAVQASKLLETGMPEEFAKKLREAISDIGKKIVKKKMEKTAANLMYNVEELVNEASKKLAFIESVIEAGNISLPRGFMKAFKTAKEQLAKANETLAAAKQALEEGDVDKALRLLVKAKTHAEQAHRIADKLEDVVKDLLRKSSGEESSSEEEEGEEHNSHESHGISSSSGQGSGQGAGSAGNSNSNSSGGHGSGGRGR